MLEPSRNPGQLPEMSLPPPGYAEFIARKIISDQPTGFLIKPEDIHDSLFGFQSFIVQWAIKRGRAAIFAGTGLGKTRMQVEWARLVAESQEKPVIIVCPLAVARQTIGEAKKIGVEIVYCKKADDFHALKAARIIITNYERVDGFHTDWFSGVVLDESSILKSLNGKVRNKLIKKFSKIPFRLSCTATPSPNDHVEILNQAHFLGVMPLRESFATFFFYSSGKKGETSIHKLKPHGVEEFWKWVASWAVFINHPRDLGDDTPGYDLPDLIFHQEKLASNFEDVKGLSGRNLVRRETVQERCEKAAEIANSHDEPIIIWCHRNDESATLARLIPGATEIKGSDKPEKKEKAFHDFVTGKIRVLVTKPSIAGFGLNWQHCARAIFVGLSDSFEAYYQAIRRAWRFGQLKNVHVHLVYVDAEGPVIENLKRKEGKMKEMYGKVLPITKKVNISEIMGSKREEMELKTATEKGEGWEMHLGDCIEILPGIPDNSIPVSLYSPPFSDLYTFTNSSRDLGNCRDHDEFLEHYQFVVNELFRVTLPGRLTIVHCQDIPKLLSKDGFIGLYDLPGRIVDAHERSGWIYHTRVTIWKNPAAEQFRTKAKGLLHKYLKIDSSVSRVGRPEYLVVFKKPGENPEPIKQTMGVDDWEKLASPIWMTEHCSGSLNSRGARDGDDIRHVTPLQSGIIKRALELWSNPGDVVLSPFAGVGSEGFNGILMGRKFMGIELKESYYQQAIKFLKEATKKVAQIALPGMEKKA